VSQFHRARLSPLPEGPKSVRNRGHRFLRDKPRGVYYPEAVGIVPGYPKTYEAWLERQAMGRKNIEGQTRAGVPSGLGGAHNRDKVKQWRVEAKERAQKIVEKIKMTKKIEFADYRAEMAMEAAVEVMEYRDPEGKRLHGAKDILAAARLICDFTQPKPVQKIENTIRTAEDWLASLPDDAE
jgi:hypothetical protein